MRKIYVYPDKGRSSSKGSISKCRFCGQELANSRGRSSHERWVHPNEYKKLAEANGAGRTVDKKVDKKWPGDNKLADARPFEPSSSDLVKSILDSIGERRSKLENELDRLQALEDSILSRVTSD